MKKLAFVALLGLAAAACTTTEERVGGAAVGAGVGAVAGPVGAVAGGAVGAVTGPTAARRGICKYSPHREINGPAGRRAFSFRPFQNERLI
jgi:osmotically inducible lipoprotein OsmB